MKTIKILLVDDHALVRAGFRSLLENVDGMEVVGEAGNGREAVSQVAKLHPEVVVMDIMMPELNGLDATARLAASHPKVRVIILSMNSDEQYVLQALRAGAAGYLLKDVSAAELQEAVRTVASGKVHLSAGVTKHVLTAFVERTDGGAKSLEHVTLRQREILQLIAEGNTTKQIAKKLGITPKTAEGHRSQLMDALDIHDIAGLVRYAIRTGLITPDQ